MVIWITGISGAGKSTICQAIVDRLKPFLPSLVNLDGDVVRAIFGDGLGHKEGDRVLQINRIQRLALEMEKQGLVVLVAALYAHPDLSAWNRKNFSDYLEVFLDAPLSLVEERDPKGLYAKVRAGQMQDVVGVDITWHKPTAPHIHMLATNTRTPDAMATEIIAAMKARGVLAPVPLSHD